VGGGGGPLDIYTLLRTNALMFAAWLLCDVNQNSGGNPVWCDSCGWGGGSLRSWVMSHKSHAANMGASVLILNSLHSRHTQIYSYGVAMISRRLQIIGLFCKRALYQRQYSAKETYFLKAQTWVRQYSYSTVCTHDILSQIYLYGVATISRLLQIIVFFCRISSLLWGSFAKET